MVITYNHMVVDELETTAPQADQLFHALADATRRDIVLRSGGGEYSVSQLAEHYPMSFAAVQKHVAVLERAGLVTKRRKGREQIVRSDAVGLRRAQEILDGLESVWRARVGRMTKLLDAETQKGTAP
jgi:DNA-binding transcriptional ArsR family regulator